LIDVVEVELTPLRMVVVVEVVLVVSVADVVGVRGVIVTGVDFTDWQPTIANTKTIIRIEANNILFKSFSIIGSTKFI
jgi:hypothetical protein